MPPKGDDDALLVEGNALTAMALMIALSALAEKDTMIALVENFLIRHEAKERATPRISKFGDILDHRDHDSLLRLCVTEATLPHKRQGTNPAITPTVRVHAVRRWCRSPCAPIPLLATRRCSIMRTALRLGPGALPRT